MKLLTIAAAICALILPGMILAQDAADAPVHWSAKPPAEPVQAGAQFEVKIEAAIDANWHMYSATQSPPPIATRFKLLSKGPFEIAGAVRQSTPITAYDPNFEIQTETFSGSAEFWIPLKSAAAAKPGEYEVSIQAYYQVCDDKTCLPPTGVPVPFKVRLIPRTGASTEAAGGGSSNFWDWGKKSFFLEVNAVADQKNETCDCSGRD